MNGSVRKGVYGAAERQAAWLLNQLEDVVFDEAKGWAVDLIIREAAGALAATLEEEKRSGVAHKNAGARGTAAHERFKERLRYINGRFLNRLDIHVDADVYVVDKNGEREAAPRPRARSARGPCFPPRTFGCRLA